MILERVPKHAIGFVAVEAWWSPLRPPPTPTLSKDQPKKLGAFPQPNEFWAETPTADCRTMMIKSSPEAETESNLIKSVSGRGLPLLIKKRLGKR